MRGSSYFFRLALVAGTAALLATGSLRAALTLVQRETFQGVGTLNSATPGSSFSTLTGNFYKRAVGPRLTTDATASSLGWSADTDFGSWNFFSPTITGGSAAALGCISLWFYADVIGDAVVAHYHDLITSDVTSHGFDFLTIGAGPDGNFTYIADPSFTRIDTGVPVPLHGWYELRVAWQQISGSTYNKGAYLRASGASAYTTLYEGLSVVNLYGDTINAATIGIKTNTGATGNYRGRIGMPAVYAMGAWADRTAAAPGVVDPPTGPVTWYVNPASGNDNNDGVTTTTAWASAGKLNAESINCGLFPRVNGYGAGDTVIIDTTTANLVLGTASLNLYTRGLNVIQSGAGEIQAWASLAAGNWSLAAGAARTYQQTLTEANPSIVPWEDDKWLNHVTASSFTGPAATPDGTSYASVTAALDALPGSFWTDGTTLYLHPFGDTHPGGDGKTYTRSYNRGGGGISAVQLLVPDMHLNGLRVRKTCLADMSSNDPVLGYCIQVNAAGGGTTLIENCLCAYGSKHIFGFTDSSTARRLTVSNCTANQGSPYSGAGGQTPWVDYSSLPGDADNQTTYLNCTTTATDGLIGATTGRTQPNFHSTWLSHNNGTGRQFSLLRWVGCSFDSLMQDQGASLNGAIQLVGTTCAGLTVNSPGVTVDRCRSTVYPFASVSAGNGILVTNSVVVASAGYYPQASPCAGTLSYIGCTVDMRAAFDSDGPATAFLYRDGALNLTWRNNVFLGTGANTVLGNATSADTFNFSHNAYQTTAVLHNYDDGTGTGPADRTLAQWQALGQDAGSLAAANLGVQADDTLSPASPAIDLGVNVGPAVDFTGTLFAVRNDAGAFEYPLPALRAAPAATQATEGAAVTLSVTVAGNGPFTYQWLCNGVAVPSGNAASLTLPKALPGQSGNYSVTVTNAGGSITVGPVAVQVTPEAFSVWQSNYFTAAELLNPGVSGPLADPDGDGLCNWLEYAFGSDPRHADGGVSVPQYTALMDTDGWHSAVSYRRLINATTLVYAVESSPDLSVWTAVNTTLVGSPQPVGDQRTEWVTARLTAPVSAFPGGRQFLRVSVSGE